MILNSRKHYLQIALNSSLSEAHAIINSLPPSDRILIEAGTPLIKHYGIEAIRQLKDWWQLRLMTVPTINPNTAYVAADLKTMDRGETEVNLAKNAGASAAVVLGLAPVETINVLIETCRKLGIDSMVDMMNIERPYQILRRLKKLPTVIILHRGVDEEHYSKKPLPIYLINKIKGSFDVLLSIAGGDTPREIESAVFNGADIVVVWKNFYQANAETQKLAEEFLKEIK